MLLFKYYIIITIILLFQWRNGGVHAAAVILATESQ